MTDVEKSEISFIMCTIYGILLHFTLFCCKKLFFCDLRCFSQSWFVAIYCVEKILAKNSDRGEKMTNIRYAPSLPCRGSTTNMQKASVTMIHVRPQSMSQFQIKFSLWAYRTHNMQHIYVKMIPVQFNFR